MTYKISIFGIVQGVGFRPFIYNLANKFKYNGFVKNDGSSLYIILQGKSINIDKFLFELKRNKPHNASINDITIKKIESKILYDDFCIKKSSKNKENLIYSALPQDLGICKFCLKELNNKFDRRFDYAFINCIYCGPRYSIIKSLPYDRHNTSMSDFKMCSTCKAEYDSNESRRFHAEPNSCSICGIKLFLFDKNKNNLANNNDAINLAISFIKSGKILAIKGVGGFNLVCKAQSNIIEKLRLLKNRPNKPFAIIFGDINKASKYFNIDKYDRKLLVSKYTPIVLLDKPILPLPDNIAPNLNTIGVVIAYTAMHKMLLREFDEPLIFTSANLSSEPIIVSKNEMYEKIANIFDYLLDYNRDIINPIDDSLIVKLESNKSIFLRPARGYYPLSIKLNKFYSKDALLALGANQKNQIALFYKDNIIISPYIADLESVDSIIYYKKVIELFLGIYNITPKIILRDCHLQYNSSKIALELRDRFNAEILNIYHHKAHFYSVLLDNNLLDIKNALGVIFDGTGLGDDNNIWGGEFFLKCGDKISRILHIKYFPLISDNNLIKDNKKIALGILYGILGDEILNLNIDNIALYHQIYKNNLNCISSSSMGRIFDFVAYFCGLEKQSYEGESGMIIESLYDKNIKDSFLFEIIDDEIILDSIILEILKEKDKIKIASKFINTIADLIIKVALKYKYPLFISGGVFQNRILCNKLHNLTKKHNIKLYMHKKITPNDGGISLGQIGAYINKDYSTM
ncbi:carbamoyltransferase HypF [Helicobacter sp. MIT 99-5507]|uniref:carbamoyltransferase HypF n=1 Tax=Helicobacter sp. MIT 99-5507 TaxID=152489 RepID=UPI000E1F3C8D|nr:carbamoyltransferase HypF [Helicobacter sp. MIT 99-5507]RDU58320.1 carbamoyltransferase HypF [Helicobacter sp. MIT 99-5507]